MVNVSKKLAETVLELIILYDLIERLAEEYAKLCIKIELMESEMFENIEDGE